MYMKTIRNILLIIIRICVLFPYRLTLTNAWRKNIPVQPTQNVSTLFLRILVHVFLDIKCMRNFAEVGKYVVGCFLRFFLINFIS